jgi:hypothetical protein
MEDVVELKDGSVLRGTIVEDIPGESLLIETRDGNRFRIPYDRIARRAREPRVVAAPTPVESPSEPTAQVTAGRKSPAAAFLLSLLIVGGGQGYNGQWGKAALMFGGAAASVAIMQAGSQADDCVEWEECGQRDLGAGGIALFYLWSLIDAPLTASAINRRLDAGVALELGPQPRIGFASDGLARRISRGRTSPQLGISFARLRF